MSQVPGEAAVGVRVTLLAGLDHPVEPDMRIRMVDLLDVMSPMAIPATGEAMGTPASMSAKVEPQTEAMEDEPFEERISETNLRV